MNINWNNWNTQNPPQISQSCEYGGLFYDVLRAHNRCYLGWQKKYGIWQDIRDIEDNFENWEQVKEWAASHIKAHWTTV